MGEGNRGRRHPGANLVAPGPMANAARPDCGVSAERGRGETMVAVLAGCEPDGGRSEFGVHDTDRRLRRLCSRARCPGPDAGCRRDHRKPICRVCRFHLTRPVGRGAGTAVGERCGIFSRCRKRTPGALRPDSGIDVSCAVASEVGWVCRTLARIGTRRSSPESADRCRRGVEPLLRMARRYGEFASGMLCRPSAPEAKRDSPDTRSLGIDEPRLRCIHARRS